MTTELGTELGTTLGTLLASMEIEGAPTFDTSKTYALTNYGTSSQYRTAVGGGEAGVATGFGVITLCVIERIAAGAQQVLARRTTGQGWATAYDQTAPGYSYSYAVNGSGVTTGTRLTTGHALSGNDVGKVIALVTFHDGANVGTYAWDGVAKRVSAIVGYTAGDATTLTQMGPSAADVTFAPFAALTYRGVPTDTQVRAVLAAARTLGDVPSKAAAEALMPGTTVTHRWSLRDVLAAANAPVADGAAAPASIPDSATLASIDAMGKVGAPVVRVIDPALYPRTSYGFLGVNAASYFETSNPGGVAGSDANGLHVRMLWMPTTLSGTRVLAGRGVLSNQGWHIQLATAALTGVIGNGQTSAYTISTADLNTWHVVEIVREGAAVRLYWDGVKVGSDVTATSTPYVPYAGSMFWGRASNAGINPASLESFRMLAGGDYATTDAEVLAAYQETMRTGKLATTPGKTEHRYDLTQDVIANGGPQNGVPAQVLDRVGTDHLARVGTGLQVSQRTERLWSYETTPILYGSEAPANAAGPDFWETSTQLGETGASSWWGAVFFAVLSQSVTSTPRELLASIASTPSRGFSIRTNLTNSTINLLAVDNAATGRAAPAAAIAAADVGKLQLYVGVYDQPALTLRSYFKRAQVSAGTSVTGYTPSTTNGFRIGQAFLSTLSANANGIAVYGVAAGLGLPSLAEIQAQYDATMATERIAAIAGKTGFRIDLTADATGGALPSTLINREGAGFTFTKNGNPGTQAQYARAFGW